MRRAGAWEVHSPWGYEPVAWLRSDRARERFGYPAHFDLMDWASKRIQIDFDTDLGLDYIAGGLRSANHQQHHRLGLGQCGSYLQEGAF